MDTGVFLHYLLFSHSEVRYMEKSINQKRLAPDSLICVVPTTLPMGFSWAVFFPQDVTDHCTLAGRGHSPLFTYDDQSAPPLLGRKRGMGSLGFRWSYAGNFGVFWLTS